MHERRGQEAHEIYRQMAARDPDNQGAAAGIAASLMLMQRYGEAAAAFETALARDPHNNQLYSGAAAACLQAGDPQKAVALCEKSLAQAPYDQACLAFMGTGLRMMGDERDETLNGYDSLIQIFDLEPPEGFSDMESFNAELCAYLDHLHPETREYINQSLRGGTQTPDNLFAAGHALVDRLQVRINETVGRYIAGLKADERHAFLSRRKKGFGYAGSWSSRLKDCGFHVNHIHSQGWISSCYYAGVPEAVNDTHARQGWIKFGEPALEGVTRRIRSVALYSPRQAGLCCFRPICGMARCRSAVPRRAPPSPSTWCRPRREDAGAPEQPGTRCAAASRLRPSQPVGEQLDGVTAPGQKRHCTHHHFVIARQIARSTGGKLIDAVFGQAIEIILGDRRPLAFAAQETRRVAQIFAAQTSRRRIPDGPARRRTGCGCGG